LPQTSTEPDIGRGLAGKLRRERDDTAAARINGHAPVPQPVTISLADAVQAAHSEGFEFGQSVISEAPALWLEAVLARKPRMPSDLEARLLQDSALPIDSLLHDEVRHGLRRGFWDALDAQALNVTARGRTPVLEGAARAAARERERAVAMEGERAVERERAVAMGRERAMQERELARAASTPPPPPRPIGDADGYDLCPDPLSARTAADLMKALRRYRIWAGEPSFRQMARLCRGKVAASTLCTALASNNLPGLEVVLAVVTACGGNEQDQKRFATAWRSIRFTQADSDLQAGPAKPLEALPSSACSSAMTRRSA
jgi:hypothetical protein